MEYKRKGCLLDFGACTFRKGGSWFFNFLKGDDDQAWRRDGAIESRAGIRVGLDASFQLLH